LLQVSVVISVVLGVVCGLGAAHGRRTQCRPLLVSSVSAMLIALAAFRTWGDSAQSTWLLTLLLPYLVVFTVLDLRPSRSAPVSPPADGRSVVV
jgi:hypothetical protein